MSDFKNIINYLRYTKQSDEHKVKQTHYPIIIIKEEYDYNYPPHEDDIEAVNKLRFNKNDGYFTIPQLINFKATKLYLYRNINGTLDYYVKKKSNDLELFSKLPNAIWEEKDATQFTEVTVVDTIYYDLEKNYCFTVIKQEELFLIGDTFLYHPNQLTEKNDEDFDFNYLDEEGYTHNTSDRFLRHLLSALGVPVSSSQKRKVTLLKQSKSGLVHNLPDIGQDSQGYYLNYNYFQKVIDYKSFINVPAISLRFKYFGALLEFLNQTVFYHLDDVSEFEDTSSKLRQQFFYDYMFFVNENLLKNRKIKTLEVFYYLPIFFFKKIDVGFLWDILEVTLDTTVTNIGLNTEDIVLKLLQGIESTYSSKTRFLAELGFRKINRKTPVLQQLIYRIDGNNHLQLLTYLWTLWKTSSFSDIDPKTNKWVDITEKSPVLLDYRSDKKLGFHEDNAKIKWQDSTNTIEVKLTKGTGVFVEKTIEKEDANITYLEEITETHTYSYHPLSPIMLISADNPKFIYKDQEQDGNPYFKLPAFILLARENGALLENIFTALQYTADVLTTISGFGNLIKLGRLYKVLKAGHNIIGKTRTFTKVVTVVKGVAGVAEITSGSVNALLKLTGIADTELGREISKYLFYFEMMALSGELSLTLYQKLQKTAKTIVKNPNFEKHLDDLVKKGELDEAGKNVTIQEILKVAEEAGSTKFVLKAKYLDDFGKLKQVSKYEDEIRKLDYEDAKFFDEEGKALSGSFSQNKKQSVSFGKNDLDDVINKAGGNPRKVILSHNHPSSTGISAEDIKIVFDKQFGAIRAIAKDGSNFFVKKTGNMSKGDFYKTTSTVAKKVKTENPDIVKKAVLDKNSKESKQLAQLLVDGLIEELIKLKEIEYIKYQ